MAIPYSSAPAGFSPAMATWSGPASSDLGLPPPIPPSNYPLETFAGFFYSIINTIQLSGIFGPQSVFFVLDPYDSVIQWPNMPPPFALIAPGSMYDRGDAIGGGRFSKVWEGSFEIHVVVRNTYDPAAYDTNAVLSLDLLSGTYVNVNRVIDHLEQSYPLDVDSQLSMVELPYSTFVGKPIRYKECNELLGFPIFFRASFCDNLPSTLP